MSRAAERGVNGYAQSHRAEDGGAGAASNTGSATEQARAAFNPRGVKDSEGLASKPPHVFGWAPKNFLG